LSIRQRLRLFRSVCEAVQYAHTHALIHRDLKPSNILVNSSGEVRLLDFGIAKQLEALDQAADQTRTELRLMTPAYAAPEQIRGEQVGAFTDVYALGVILYQLLTGHLLYDLSTGTPGEIERAILERDPEKPSASAAARESRGESWVDLDVLCSTAMHRDIGRRYRSAEALIRDVDHYLKGEPLEARPDTLGYRAGKFVARNRRAVLATVLGTLAIIGLVVFFTVRLAIARNNAQATAARLQRVQQFMLNLFQGGDKNAGPAADLKVVSLLDRGVKEAQALQREPEVQAELYLTLGGIYRKLGKLNEADELMQSALAQRKAILGTNNPEVSDSLLALGRLRIDQARFDDAEKFMRQSLDQIEKRRPQDLIATAKATAALGKVLEARGLYDKAIPLLERAVNLQTASGGTSLDMAADLKELADAEFYAGHYDRCETLTNRSLDIHRRLIGEHHPLVADDYINLGAIQFERGHYSDAERFYRQALEINRSWYGKENPETASTLSMLGRSLVFQKRYDEAVQVVEQALAIQEHVYGEMHPRVANVLNELGTVALQRNRYDEAAERFSRMMQIYKSAYGEAHYQYGLAMANLASVYLAKGEFARAEAMFGDVLKVYAKSLSPDHMFIGIAQIKLGRALVGEKRYADAESHLLNGYQILTKQTSPQVSWVQSARKELVTVYQVLNKPEKAAEFR
jgi:eukaryotic-like serine/threonine-protein kinase